MSDAVQRDEPLSPMMPMSLATSTLAAPLALQSASFVLPPLPVLPIPLVPRVAFTAFRSADAPMLQAWRRFRGDLTVAAAGSEARPSAKSGELRTADGQAIADGQAFGFWRLLATNNRELGRSYLLYTSPAHARAHVRRFQDEPEALSPVYISAARGGARGWVITFHGTAVMTCSRWYESASTRTAAASAALAAIAVATSSEVPHESGPSGRFSRRSTVGRDAGTP